MVLNMGPPDWELSTLTTRQLLLEKKFTPLFPSRHNNHTLLSQGKKLWTYRHPYPHKKINQCLTNISQF